MLKLHDLPQKILIARHAVTEVACLDFIAPRTTVAFLDDHS